ncbi:MAG: hypothetical protein QW819_03900 [Candidatus Korarchaeota archaeon]
MQRSNIMALMIVLVLLISPLVISGNKITEGTLKNILEIQGVQANIQGIQMKNPQINSLFIPRIRTIELTLPFEMKVLLDDRYAYFNSTRLATFLGDLSTIYGFTIYDKRNFTTYDRNNITNFWALIWPNPSDASFLPDAEKDAIMYFINESNGFAMILADWYNYLKYYILNNITRPFGIHILNASLRDPTNYIRYVYFPIIHTWADNTVASGLGGGGTYIISTGGVSPGGGTGIELLEGNTSWKTVWILATGDSDTYVYNPNKALIRNQTVVYDGNIVVFALANTTSGGLLFVSGSVAAFSENRFCYPNASYNNRMFALNLIEYALSRDLALVNIEVPERISSGYVAYVNMTVRNNANRDISNVHVGLEIRGALELLNASNIYNISILHAGEEVRISFALKATGTSDVVMEAKAWSDDTSVVGYQRRYTFKTLGLILSAQVTPDELLLDERDNATLLINITNPSTDQAINVNVSIVLPEGVYTNNDTFYHFDTINGGASINLTLILKVTTTGLKVIEVYLVSENFGTAYAEAQLSVKALTIVANATFIPDYLVMTKFDKVMLVVNVTNPSPTRTAENVNVSIILSEGIYTNNSTFYHFDVINCTTSIVLKLEVRATTTGQKIAKVNVTSGNFGTAYAEANLLVCNVLIVYDEAHDYYFTASYLSKFVALLEKYGGVYVNRRPFDKNLLGNASLLIMMHPQAPLSSEEITLVKNYLNNGGKIIIAATWYKYFQPYVNNITADYGIYFVDSEIMDNTYNIGGKPYYPILYNLARHPMCLGVQYVAAPSSAYMLITPDVTAIVRGNPTSYGVSDEGPTGVNGSNLIAVATKRLSGGGIIVALGGASIVSDWIFENNSVFIENMIRWIFDTENPNVTISVEYTYNGTYPIRAKITVSASDNIALKRILITINGTVIHKNETLLVPEYTYLFEIADNGTYVIRVVVMDWSDLTSEAEETVTIILPPAPSPPPPPPPSLMPIVAIVVVCAILVVAAIAFLRFKIRK